MKMIFYIKNVNIDKKDLEDTLLSLGIKQWKLHIDTYTIMATAFEYDKCKILQQELQTKDKLFILYKQ